MPSVLFVCTANRFRSPLASAFFQQMLESSGEAGSWSVDSAGTWSAPGFHVLPEVLWIARKHGIDLSQHRSRLVSEGLLSARDLILVMEMGHREALQNEFRSSADRVHLLSQVAEGRVYDIPDLIESAESMMEVGETLHELIRTGFGNICDLAVRLQTDRKN